jgi:cobalt/nickel transport protein
MRRAWPFLVAGLGVCLLLATFLSPFASAAPDGLERVAADRGFLRHAEEAPLWRSSPLPDYEVPGVRGTRAATGLAGLAGTLIVFGLSLGIGRLLARRRSSERGPGEASEQPLHRPSR